MKRYYVIFKGGKEQFIIANSPEEAMQEVREMLYEYVVEHPIVGYYEVQPNKNGYFRR